jgi:hypothetical protein
MYDAPKPLVIGRISVEPPEGWGPRRMLITRLERLGYAVEEHIVVGVSVLVITGTEPGPQITSGYLRPGGMGPILDPLVSRRSPTGLAGHPAPCFAQAGGAQLDLQRSADRVAASGRRLHRAQGSCEALVQLVGGALPPAPVFSDPAGPSAGRWCCALRPALSATAGDAGHSAVVHAARWTDRRSAAAGSSRLAGPVPAPPAPR